MRVAHGAAVACTQQSCVRTAQCATKLRELTICAALLLDIQGRMTDTLPMNAKQLRTIAKFEAQAHALGHEFHAYPDGRMVAQNQFGERMYWQVLTDGAALVTDENGDD